MCVCACHCVKEFVEKEQRWAHIDIAGVMESSGEVPYLGKGMSGKLLCNLACLSKIVQS